MWLLSDELVHLRHVIRQLSRLMQWVISFFIQTDVLLVKQVSRDIDRGLHLDPAHVFALSLWSYKGVSCVIYEFPHYVEGNEGSVSEEEHDGHGERELGG